MQWNSIRTFPVHYWLAGRSRFSSVHLEESFLSPLHTSHRNLQECRADRDHLVARRPCESRFLSWRASPPRWVTVFLAGSRAADFSALAPQTPFFVQDARWKSRRLTW